MHVPSATFVAVLRSNFMKYRVGGVGDGDWVRVCAVATLSLFLTRRVGHLVCISQNVISTCSCTGGDTPLP